MQGVSLKRLQQVLHHLPSPVLKFIELVCNSASRNSWKITELCSKDPSAHCRSVSSARIQPKKAALRQASCSTSELSRSFASTSSSHAWAPARTLEREHPHAPTDSRAVVEFLSKMFPPLEFPEDVALRIITHTSWKGGAEGHNGRLAFIGTASIFKSCEGAMLTLSIREKSIRMLS